MNKYFFNEQNETTDGVKPILKDEVNNRTYELQKILGVGASCAVYKAKEGKRDCLIKELNPRGSNITRNDKGELICADERAKASFDKRLARFKESCEWQTEFRNIAELKNHTGPIVSVFSANNTCYSEIVDFNATDYSKYTDKSLKELLERIRAITKVISIYHNKGYLHLDIKPANVLVFEQAEKMPILIDFDSITTKEEIMETGIASYSKDWAAYEQTDSECIYEIDKATDLFAIGEMLFFKIFGRHSETFERFGLSKFDFNKDDGLLKDMDHKIYPLLTEIFNHTICNSISSRYQTAEELIEKLDKAIELADPKRAFLPVCNLNTKDFFVGRDNELAEIEQKLKECDELYVSGFGGIGKSELVRQYTKLHKSEFDSIVFVTFNSDLESMLDNINIVNFVSIENEEIYDRLQRILNKLREFKNNGEKILFVVDNFDTELQDEERQLFDEFVSCAEKTIVTTRNIDVDGKTMVSIGAVKNPKEIFNHHYGRQLSLEEDKAVNEVLDIFQGHTLATELLAKQMKASRIVPSLMLERLESKGLREIGNEKIKYGNKKNNAYSFIKEIFDVSELTSDEIYVLVNLSLIISDGIDTEVFHDFCDLKTYDHINGLVERGWIIEDKNEAISLHPLISEIMLEELQKESDRISPFLCNVFRVYLNEEKTKPYEVQSMVNGVCDKLYKCNIINNNIVAVWYGAAIKLSCYGSAKNHIARLHRIVDKYDAKIVPKYKVLKQMGYLYVGIDEYINAKNCYEQALSLSDDNAVSFVLKTDIAAVCIKLDLYDEALTIIEEIREYVDSLSVEKLSDFPMDIFYLLEANYAKINSVFDRSIYYYDKVLEYQIDKFGYNNKHVAVTYNNLANIYSLMEDFSQAELYYKKSLEIHESLYGNKNTLTLNIYNNLSSALINQNKYKEAEEIIKNIYEPYIEIFCKDNSKIIWLILNIASIKSEIYNDYVSAAKYLEKAMNISNDIYVKDHHIKATIQTSLGVAYRELRQFDKAINMLVSAKDIFIEVYKVKKHYKIATVYSALGKTYELDKQYDMAKECYLKSIAIRKEIFKPDHPKVKLVEERLKNLEKLIAEEN